MVKPDDIQLIGDTVAIRWSDGVEDYFSMERLRALSPSAENQGERDLLGNLYGGTDQTEFPGVTVAAWVPVGGYAIQLSFSDGHKTGIYSFDYLRRIGEAQRDASAGGE